jgi:hypothetical protein
MKKAADRQPVAEGARPKVGDLVAVGAGAQSFKGKVVEDRGPIGAGGRRLYGIVDFDPEPTVLELPADRFAEVVSFGSEHYLRELYEAIVEAAARSKADIIVSNYGVRDVQVRGRSMLQNIPDRSRIVEQIDAMLADEAESRSGRIIRRDRGAPGDEPRQHWYVVRAG